MGGRLGANPCTNHMQKAISLFEKGPLALVAGEDLNPRPLGYEPYDVCLWRPEQSLAGVVTPADRTAPSRSVGSVSPVSYCLVASGLQIGLQNRLLICSFTHPPLPSVAAVPGRAAPCPDSASDCQAARPRHATRRLRSCQMPGCTALSRHHRCRVCTGAPTTPAVCPAPTPNPAAAGPDGRRGSVQGRRSRSRSDPQAP